MHSYMHTYLPTYIRDCSMYVRECCTLVTTLDLHIYMLRRCVYRYAHAYTHIHNKYTHIHIHIRIHTYTVHSYTQIHLPGLGRQRCTQESETPARVTGNTNKFSHELTHELAAITIPSRRAGGILRLCLSLANAHTQKWGWGASGISQNRLLTRHEHGTLISR